MTRNHCCQFMWQLIRNVKIFLKRALVNDLERNEKYKSLIIMTSYLGN
ncbi:hypothetical protein XCR1_1160004 [Xenorhabdus cabanillasii JM26]|uniref:Uncharacterized protein n=1 Tax=Xenorhabdus cabanillasii JM26 TaxID=1427517 RepID=W1IPG3_9GAMM|nr:hypothetical protein XCR1_1160004 [Xenorhabdus cabanillasii JM26]